MEEELRNNPYAEEAEKIRKGAYSHAAVHQDAVRGTKPVFDGKAQERRSRSAMFGEFMKALAGAAASAGNVPVAGASKNLAAGAKQRNEEERKEHDRAMDVYKSNYANARMRDVSGYLSMMREAAALETKGKLHEESIRRQEDDKSFRERQLGHNEEELAVRKSQAEAAAAEREAAKKEKAEKEKEKAEKEEAAGKLYRAAVTDKAFMGRLKAQGLERAPREDKIILYEDYLEKLEAAKKEEDGTEDPWAEYEIKE